MSPIRHSRRLACLAALMATVLATATAAPAVAAPAKTKARYVVGAQGNKPALTFKDKASFSAYVLRHFGVDLTRKPRSLTHPTAKASWAGDYATFYWDYNGGGNHFDVASGTGGPNLWSENCILFWCTNFDDQISAVYTHGVPAILYTETNYRGSYYLVPPDTKVNLPYWFNDIASSVYVYWS